MIYIILGTIVIVGFTNFTGMGLSLGRTKLMYNNFEVEDEYKEEVPEYVPPAETTMDLNLNKEEEYHDINESSGFKDLDSNTVTQSPPSFNMNTTLQPPDVFGSGNSLFEEDSLSSLTEDERDAVGSMKPMSKFESKFQSTEASVYEEWEDDNVMPDFTTGFGDLYDGNYSTDDLVSTLASGGLNHVHG